MLVQTFSNVSNTPNNCFIHAVDTILISSFILNSNFMQECESTRTQIWSEVCDGKLWKEFTNYKGKSELWTTFKCSQPSLLGFLFSITNAFQNTIPGPKETINTLLAPLVSWFVGRGFLKSIEWRHSAVLFHVTYQLDEKSVDSQQIFVSHRNYSDRASWPKRTNQKHRDEVTRWWAVTPVQVEIKL